MGWKTAAGYDVLEQDYGYSCGMACVAMIVKMTGGGTPTENSIIQISKEFGGQSYKAALADKPGMGPRMLTATSAPASDTGAGTGMENLSKILTALKVVNTCNHYGKVAEEIAKTP